MKHLASLRAESEIAALEQVTQAYLPEDWRRYPEKWSDLVRAGMLRGVPVDPNGTPYKLRLDGTVQVEDPKPVSAYIERHGAKEIK